MENCYIILFKDGCIQIFNKPQEQRDFSKDAKCFEVEWLLSINYICEWASRGFNHNKFKRIW